MKLTDLIPSYNDLLPEPSERYAEIIRIAGPDNRPVVESFHLAEALAHPENAPRLQALDTIRIFGRYDLETAPEFSVFGEVRHPGSYRSSGQAHLRDAIYQAGGVTPRSMGILGATGPVRFRWIDESVQHLAARGAGRRSIEQHSDRAARPYPGAPPAGTRPSTKLEPARGSG